MRILKSRNLLFILIIIGVFASCKKKDNFNTSTDVKLSFSTDNMLFDTVFSTIGSTTKYFVVKNTDSKKIKISSISLATGNASNFRMNIDGTPAVSLNDVEIAGNDSIYIFVKVTVDPQNSNSPMVVKDSIIFQINGNEQDVKLTAWGQDAHYIVADKVYGSSLKYKIVAGENENITWPNDKPYLIYGYAVVDSTATLNIDAGARIHFYNASGMWIYKGGNIKVNGTMADPVTFQGSRLDADYKELPGQWDRIWINEGSKDNVFNYAIIKNGFIGIQAETMQQSMGNQLTLTNTIIENMSGMGVFTKFYKIQAGNCVIGNCGVYAVCLTTGGDYDFRHCSIGNNWSYSTRNTPSLVIANYYDDYYSGVTYTGDLDKAYFGNCIVWGMQSEEVLPDSLAGAGLFNYKFENCILKTELSLTDPAHFVNCHVNDPLFKDASNNDYRLSPGSYAIDIGTMSVINTSTLSLITDILGNNRAVNPPPDLGAYDYVP
ncbi:MAG: hypothetical protein WCM76_08930 [Bacteroidota bacterium]